MILAWKPFQIDINKFKKFLDTNVPGSDGILCFEENFEIVLTSEAGPDAEGLIQAYYDSLIEVSEALSIGRPALILQAISDLKLEMINKQWNDMTPIERKIMLNMSLTEIEISELLNE